MYVPTTNTCINTLQVLDSEQMYLVTGERAGVHAIAINCELEVKSIQAVVI